MELSLSAGERERENCFSAQRKERRCCWSSCVVSAVANDGGIKRLFTRTNERIHLASSLVLELKEKRKRHPSSAHAIIPPCLPVCVWKTTAVHSKRELMRKRGNISLIGFFLFSYNILGWERKSNRKPIIPDYRRAINRTKRKRKKDVGVGR